MRLLVYGGGFNPPHLGHVSALETACAALRPDRILIIPDGTPPHKPLPPRTPAPEDRLRLCRLTFPPRPELEISELALAREGPCYMIDTVRLLRREFPRDELILLLGSDMLLSFDQWRAAPELLRDCSLAALCREGGERAALEEKARFLEETWQGRVLLLDHKPLEISSSRLRELLPLRGGAEYLSPEAYREIIRLRLYGAKPDLSWLWKQVEPMLEPRRAAHVLGCEASARALALRWGLDPDLAAEAAILHDCTKSWTPQEQLDYCRSRGLVLDEGELDNPLLYHARSGAVAAAELFGAPPEVCEAIRWHTTGKPEMDLLEKILYLADKIEPTRSFPGVESVRELAAEDLDAAMGKMLFLSTRSILRRKMTVYKDTLDACRFYASRVPDNKEESPC